MRNTVAAIVLTFMLWPTAALRAQAYHVGVDPRIELMSVVFRLAGNNEYNQCRIPAYNKALEQYFAAYKEHAAVKLARHTQMGFDGPMFLAVHLKDVESLAELVPFDRPGIQLARLEGWDPAKAREFVAALRKFVKDTHFARFLESQQQLYDVTNLRLKAFMESRLDLKWYDQFFGSRPPARFIVVPGMTNGGSSYGPSFVGEDGAQEMYAIPGVYQVDAEGLPVFSPDWLDTMAHEFIHSYSNPAVDKFAAQMERSAGQINAPVHRAMQRQGYGGWKTLLYESMVRASTIQYIVEHEGIDAARRRIREENARSFVWMDKLCDLLGTYRKDRQQYPTFESFMPRVVSFFDDLASHSPKVASVNVANGAREVDSKLTEIIVRFTQPMSTTDWNTDPRFRMGRFDVTATVLTIPVELDPDHEYELPLQWPSGQPLASAAGAPLQVVTLKFRTRKATS
jgi:hypothetical protein